MKPITLTFDAFKDLMANVCIGTYLPDICMVTKNPWDFRLTG